MIGKLLLTLAVILGAYGVLRARWRANRIESGVAPGLDQLQRSDSSWQTMRLAASLLIAIMAVGSALYLANRWFEDQEVVQVQVINANTGRITLYESRRGSVEGREFQTLDGRTIRLADVERMIILHAEPDLDPNREPSR
jgi:anti-sigma-K factor RskA